MQTTAARVAAVPVTLRGVDRTFGAGDGELEAGSRLIYRSLDFNSYGLLNSYRRSPRPRCPGCASAWPRDGSSWWQRS